MESTLTFSFCCRAKIHCGQKALEHLPFELEALDSRMPMVLTSAGGTARPVVKAFKGSGCTLALMEGLPVPANEQHAAQLARLYRQNHCDAIIAVGAGELVDLAKAVNILVSHEDADLAAFAGTDRIDRVLKPLVVVPTVGGSAFESSHRLCLGETTIASPRLMPDLVVIDERLAGGDRTVALAAMALAALAHGVSAAAGPQSNPVMDVYALSALKLVAGHLVATVQSTKRRQGCTALINAAALAGCAYANSGPSTVHVLAGMAASRSGLPLGLFLGILTPYCLEYLHLKEGRSIDHLLLDLVGTDVAAMASQGMQGAIVINALHALLYDVTKASRGQVPSTLAQTGIDRQQLGPMAQQAAQDHPGLCDAAGAAVILEHAWLGIPMVSL
jgi:alcohol dehydrogenase